MQLNDLADGTGQKVETTALTIPAGNFKWQLPIPQSERDLNSTTESLLLNLKVIIKINLPCFN
jgi:hypothetical protein